MITKTRTAIFETNSSSTHSITIADGKFVFDKIPIEKDGVCRIYGRDFYGSEELFSATSKASYAMVEAYMEKDVTKIEMLKTVIEAVVKVPVEFTYNDEFIERNDGYEGEDIFESAESLMRFIFNPMSGIVMDYNG